MRIVQTVKKLLEATSMSVNFNHRMTTRPSVPDTTTTPLPSMNMTTCITPVMLAAAGNIIACQTRHQNLEQQEQNHPLYQESWIVITKQKEDHPLLEMCQVEQTVTSDTTRTGLYPTSEGQTITRTLTVQSKYCEKNKIIDSQR